MKMKNILKNSYRELKIFFDENLNKDKTHFVSSNDETTPIGCVEEMINKIPNEFWKREKIKILDPCCGNGNFHLVILNKLRKKGLKDKDILKDILHFNDISDCRLNFVKNIFSNNKYYLNISNNDFLQSDNNKYDLIVANPPYAKFMKDGTKRSSKNHTLVRDFIFKSLNSVKENGYILFIVPNNWMSLANRNKIISQLTELEFVYLNIGEAKKWFPKIGSSFTWFIVKNCLYKKEHKFLVDCVFKKQKFSSYVKSQKRDYIPLLYNDVIQTILTKVIDEENIKFNVETTSDLHATTKKHFLSLKKDEKYKYKLIHTPKQLRWSKKPHKFQEGWKLFISTTDKYSVFIDNCGMTQSIAFIRCSSKEDAQKYKKILEHPLYIFINNICRWGNFNNIRILQKFPYPKDEKNIYKSFNLNEKEINFIKTFI